MKLKMTIPLIVLLTILSVAVVDLVALPKLPSTIATGEGEISRGVINATIIHTLLLTIIVILLSRNALILKGDSIGRV